jgi:hypothetical protein
MDERGKRDRDSESEKGVVRGRESERYPYHAWRWIIPYHTHIP